jgi:protein-disulfide isomerase
VPELEQVLERYPKEVKVVFKNFPLRNHKFAQKAAVAALGAGRQGKFWEFHDMLFENYNKLNDQKINQIARTLGLDMEKLEKDMKDPHILSQVSRDKSDGIRAGVRSTPTVFINGRLTRNRTLEGMQAKIEKQL